MSISGGIGTNELVAGARLEKVGGSRNIVSHGATSERVFGVKKISVGSTTLKASGAIVTEAASGSITAGTTKIKSGVNVVVSGSTIELSASSITVSAGASYSASGTHKASGAKVTVDAPSSKHEAPFKADG
jgi:hypothetical protein